MRGSNAAIGAIPGIDNRMGGGGQARVMAMRKKEEDEEDINPFEVREDGEMVEEREREDGEADGWR
eukprot:3938426-Rhodomonas_salina.1